MICGRVALSFAEQGHVNADEIGVLQRIFKRNILDKCFLFSDAARQTQVFHFLDGFDVIVILVGRVVAQDVHVEAVALFNHGEADAAGADNSNRLAGNFVSEERQIRMPIAPFVFAGQVLGSPHAAGERAHHEEGKFCGGFGENVCSVSEWNLVAVGVGAVDIVEAYGNLGDDFEIAFAGFEDLGVNRVAQSGDQAIDSRLHFFDD